MRPDKPVRWAILPGTDIHVRGPHRQLESYREVEPPTPFARLSRRLYICVAARNLVGLRCA